MHAVQQGRPVLVIGADDERWLVEAGGAGQVTGVAAQDAP
jgi:hypothetical protein